MGVVERVQPLVGPILADLGLDLYDLEHAGGTLKVTIDKDGGVDLEDLALATRLISRELDHRDPIPGRYTLEVTSPGLERALRTPEHFRRAVGRKVNLRTLAHVAGERRVEGDLVAADDEHIRVRITETGPALGTERTLALVDVERARTVFEWGGAPKPGKPQPGRKKTAPAAGKRPVTRADRPSDELDEASDPNDEEGEGTP